MKITPTRLVIVGLLLGTVAALLLLVAWERFTREPPNYSLIEDRLYLGGWVREPPPGTDAVLNLCETPDPYECEIHRWLPIRDAEPAPSIEWLRHQVAFIDAQHEAGRTVYVHCANGASRSSMVVIAHVMRKQGWPRDRALEFVRAKRWQTRPNPAFMDLLSEWERTLAADRVARK